MEKGELSRVRARSLGRTLDEAVFTFVDVETTGLSPETARVCEVAAVSYSGGSRVAQLSSLVNPGGPIPAEASAIHGITDAMVAGSPSFGELAWRLLDQIEGSVLVAHNAKFDLDFLRMEFERSGLKFPDLPVADTWYIARVFGTFSNNRLGTIARELDIPAENWHRALSDVEMTRRIFEHFMVIFRKDGAVTVADVLKRIYGADYEKQAF